MKIRALKNKRFCAVIAVALTVLTGLIWVIGRSGEEESLTVFPSPNGYDDFLAAEEELAGGLPDLSMLPPQELKVVFSEHPLALRRARKGITQNCRVRLNYSLDDITNHLVSAKALGLLFRAEGRLAETDLEFGNAMQCYLESIQFVSKRFHGGLAVHHLVGIAIEKGTVSRIEQIIPKLSVDDCRKAINTLQEVEVAEESSETIQRRERRWNQEISSASSLQRMLMDALPRSRKTRAIVAGKLMDRTRRRRFLLLELASRAYQADKGRLPANAEALVPLYLVRIPADPGTGKNLSLQSSNRAQSVAP